MWIVWYPWQNRQMLASQALLLSVWTLWRHSDWSGLLSNVASHHHVRGDEKALGGSQFVSHTNEQRAATRVCGLRSAVLFANAARRDTHHPIHHHHQRHDNMWEGTSAWHMHMFRLGVGRVEWCIMLSMLWVWLVPMVGDYYAHQQGSVNACIHVYSIQHSGKLFINDFRLVGIYLWLRLCSSSHIIWIIHHHKSYWMVNNMWNRAQVFKGWVVAIIGSNMVKTWNFIIETMNHYIKQICKQTQN